MGTISPLSGTDHKPNWREREFRLENKYPLPDALVFRKGRPVMTRGEITVITGVRKTFKTHIYQEVLKSTLIQKKTLFDANSGLTVLVLDTEQHPSRLQEQYTALLSTAGLPTSATPSQFKMFYLLGFSPQEMTDTLLETTKEYHPDIVIIDGIADFVDDINSYGQCAKLVTTLQSLAMENNCSIVPIIHQNPGTRKERGHLGTILGNKTAGYISLERFGDIVQVKCLEGCRGEPFPAFAVRFDSETKGLVETDGLPTYPQSLGQTRDTTKADAMAGTIPSLFVRDYSGTLEQLQKSELAKRICEVHHLDKNHRNTAYRAIDKALHNGILLKTPNGLFTIPQNYDYDTQEDDE